MSNTIHIRRFRVFFNTLLAILVLGSSCSVKNLAAEIFEVTAPKTLNPAKSQNTGTTSCVQDFQQAIETGIKAGRIKGVFPHSQFYNTQFHVPHKAYSRQSSTKFVPKTRLFLLYQKLKLPFIYS